MKKKIFGFIVGVSLLLGFTGSTLAALVTFTVPSGLGTTTPVPIVSSGITLTLFNPLTESGLTTRFLSDPDGLGIGNDPPDLQDFNFSFDAPVTIISYEIGFINNGTVGTFDLLGPNGNSTGNPLNPVGTFPINGSFTLLAGQTGTFDTTSLSGPVPLSQILRITVHAVPVPSAMLLMGTGLFGLVGWRWWSRRAI